MMVDQPTNSSEPRTPADEPPHYSAEAVRGGEIILRGRWQRLVFIAGLVGFGILAVLVTVAG